MLKNAMKFSELLVKSVGTVDTEMERDRVGAEIIERAKASKVIGKKLIVCNRAVK